MLSGLVSGGGVCLVLGLLTQMSSAVAAATPINNSPVTTPDGAIEGHAGASLSQLIASRQISRKDVIRRATRTRRDTAANPSMGVCSTRVGVTTGFRDSLGNNISYDNAKSNFPVIAGTGSYILGTETANCQIGFGGNYKFSTEGIDAATPVFLKPTTSSTALTCYFDSSSNLYCSAPGGYNTFCEDNNKYLYIAKNSCPTGYTTVTLKGF